MNEPIRELIAAVLEGIDLPAPATIGDAEAHRETLAARAMLTAVALRGILDGRPDDLGWNLDFLRARLAEHPVNYTTWADRHAAPEHGEGR